METRTYTVYKFNELPRKAQDNVIEKLHTINVDDGFWYQSILTNWKEELAKVGYNDAEISFSGFGSQGDGASFTCSVDLAKWFDARPMYKDSYPAIYSESKQDNYHLRIKKVGRYSWEKTMLIDWHYYGDSEEAEKQFIIISDVVLKDARGKAKEIYEALDKEYVYCTSDEAIVETIDANDYDFLFDGTIDRWYS